MLFRTCYIILFLFSLLNAQTSILDSKELGITKPKKLIEAILGDNIEAPGGSAVILDASKSRPNNGSLTFEWSFPENLIFEDDYEYDKSQTVITYSSEELKEVPFQNKTSIKTLVTRNQYIELDLPNYTTAKTFSIILKVQNHVGMKDFDTLFVNLIPPIKTSLQVVDVGDEYLSIQDSSKSVGVELTETIIDESLLSIQPINKNLFKPREIDLINSLIFNEIKNKGFDNVLNPNRYISEEIKLNRLYERFKIVKDTVITENNPSAPAGPSLIQKIQSFFIKDKNNDSLKTTTTEDTLNIVIKGKDDSTLEVVLADEEDPDLKIDSLSNDSTVVTDSINTENLFSLGFFKSFFQKFSKKQENNVILKDSTSLIVDDSSVVKNITNNDIPITDISEEPNKTIEYDSSLVSAVTYDTTIVVDTLKYNVVVDTTLFYNFSCASDSCAGENAILEGAGKVLTWGLNDDSELELRFFSVANLFNEDVHFDWVISNVQLNPSSKEKIIYPTTLATSITGSLFVGEANSNNILEITKDQNAQIVVEGNILNEELSKPSGMEIGSNQEIYFSDKYNNRILINSGESFRTLVNSKSKYNNQDNSSPMDPSSIRIGPNGAVYVLFDKDGSVYKIAKREISTILNPNILDGIDDFAINSKGEIFILSTEMKKIYKIINKNEIITIAGLDRPDKNRKIYMKRKGSNSLSFSGTALEPALMNDVPSKKIPFGNPVSIDIDLNDNLYIADDEYGTIRRIDKEGIISTFFGPSDELKGVSQIRLTNEENFQIYISKPFAHELKKISLSEISPWVKKSTIDHPRYIIQEKGVYGLEDQLNESLSFTLDEILPTVRKTFLERISNQNKNVTKFMGKNPLFCGLLLLLVNQGVAASLEDPPKLPPDFPF